MDVKISIVTPVYGCKECVYELYTRVCKAVEPICSSLEIIYVNDSSPDNPWETIESLCKKDKKVKAINLSRNFGQHNAITAGLKHATGNWVVVMDCDLQDRPEEIPRLYKKALEGFEIVLAQRTIRKDGFLKLQFSKWFYKFLGYLTNTHQDHTVANFGIYKDQVIQAVLNMNDSIRYFPTMVQWVGFKSTAIQVKHSERIAGKTSYNIRSLLNLGTNVVISFSDKPLLLVIRFGLLISLISLLGSIIFLVKYFLGQIEVLGFTSLILSLWFFSGVIIITLGIIGLYLGKTFDRVKERPLFIIKDKLNL